MSEPIDTAIEREKAWVDETDPSISSDHYVFIGRVQSLEAVRDGRIVTDDAVQVDRLARALASIDPLWVNDESRGQCEVCGLIGRWTAPNEIEHAPDCPFVWATEYVAERDGR